MLNSPPRWAATAAPPPTSSYASSASSATSPPPRRLAVDYLDNLGEELTARAARAVGLKTVIGALCGLDFDPARPARGAVIAAANRRLADPKAPLDRPRPAAVPALERGGRGQGAGPAGPSSTHGFGGQAGEPHRADPGQAERLRRGAANRSACR
ncbi:hypothetical protein GCM10020220_004080 [Nonomuraea rubra]|uniref:hypothetical protein n=1 Tax=Nonomuraea rubra TaxID=46180 RepID=UPI0031E53BFD